MIGQKQVTWYEYWDLIGQYSRLGFEARVKCFAVYCVEGMTHIELISRLAGVRLDSLEIF